ncbi:hypothetical protein [Acinetobacter pragensis]|uniref:Iron transporter n=1 Tax=Acinetobacter pragensis TaxID=1806892 RepID=A0A151Y472_9GAMM|nr:hypothetical protein [Acinetobacter pragensis]KYQ72842.1 hypothetical protein AZH43_08300 [Acinetobacter pragensis]
MHSLRYPLAVLYRFIAAFGIGYLCCYFLALNLTLFFHLYWPKAESIYLAAFIALIFYAGFVIFAFCTPHLKRLSLFSFALLLGLFALYHTLG